MTAQPLVERLELGGGQLKITHQFLAVRCSSLRACFNAYPAGH